MNFKVNFLRLNKILKKFITFLENFEEIVKIKENNINLNLHKTL